MDTILTITVLKGHEEQHNKKFTKNPLQNLYSKVVTLINSSKVKLSSLHVSQGC